MIYTSYFANVTHINVEDIELISIALTTPRGFNGKMYKQLAPTSKLLNNYKSGKINQEEYAVLYKQQLAQLNVHTVVNNLKHLAAGKTIILLCWEGKNKFCHRHFVSKWLCDNGYYTTEL